MLWNDGNSCAVFAYTWLVFDHLTRGDAGLRDRVNEHSAFWNGVLGALQTAAFVGLGRVFDTKASTDSAKQLLRFARTNRGIFSRKSIEARKINSGLSAADAKEFAAAAYELQTGGLASLIAEFEKQRKFYIKEIGPIRHNVFAHSGRLTHEARDALFTNLSRPDFEQLAVFPLRLYESLFRLYEGREPVFEGPPTSITEMLTELPPSWITAWEHLHVARTVSVFLETLRDSSLPRDRSDML